MNTEIRNYHNDTDREQVINLWKEVFNYKALHNDPAVIIDSKIINNDKLFFVSVDGSKITGTLLAGYDGHRGWIYSMAVDPGYRNRNIGSDLMAAAEKALRKNGCIKINLQILPGNEDVVRFYQKCGYNVEQRISMGKKMYETE